MLIFLLTISLSSNWINSSSAEKGDTDLYSMMSWSSSIRCTLSANSRKRSTAFLDNVGLHYIEQVLAKLVCKY